MDTRIIRFGLGTAGVPRSHLWRMWVQGNETYLGTRMTLGIAKVSLHSSGHSVLTVGTSQVAINRRGLSTGIVLGPRIAFPGIVYPDALSNRDSASTKPTVLFEPPEQRLWRDFAVLVSNPSLTAQDVLGAVVQGAELIGPLKHRDGGNVWLVTFLTPMSDAEFDYVNTERDKFRIAVRSDPSSISSAVALLAQEVSSGETVLFSIGLGTSHIQVERS